MIKSHEKRKEKQSEGLILKVSKETQEALKFNMIKLLQMKDLTTEQKGEIVLSVIAEEKISQREFAKRYELPHSTVHDWCSGRQMKKYYKNKMNELDSLLDRILFIITRKEYKSTEKTKRLVKELKNELEKIE